ncbi:MAG: carboxypeptidase regulatory-like domain-containing protein, partial [Candidatus Eremiobacteraeota bacterium]|nr:carboxypeptidase regulatory-like domain-containing protein [Candidatus Eremiobacteraeota bacterium]
MRDLIERARALRVPFALFIATIASAGIAAAQTTPIEVHGTVVADDGTPVAGASVTLSASGHSETARSDAHGHFTVDSVEPGTYAVHAAAPGFAMVSQQTVSVDTANATLNVVLFRATTNSLTVI